MGYASQFSLKTKLNTELAKTTGGKVVDREEDYIAYLPVSIQYVM